MYSIDEIKAAKLEIISLKAETQKKVKKVFHDGVKQLFEEHPALKQISWHQYTPYFNDGNTCHFRSGHDYCDINNQEGHADEEDDEDGNGLNEDYEKLSPKDQKKIDTAVKEFMEVWDDDDMLGLFGDHVTVIVTPKGVTTDDYEHD